MTGPYEYVPPVYWLADRKAGGAYSYNTETSPGPAIPPRESLEKFIPKDHLWPIDDVWNFHAGLERFTNVNIFTDGLNRRYGQVSPTQSLSLPTPTDLAATSLDDYLRKAQAMAYDGERAMFEAYSRNKYKSTGVIQWMLDNAWPSLIWHLYDYYLVPAGGYFGTKKACEPIHVQYSYDDNSIAVVNSTYAQLRSLRVTAKVLNLDGAEKGTQDATLDLDPDSVKKAFDLPKIAGLSRTYFLRLELHNSGGKLVSDNFYWLSTKLDTLDWPKQDDTVYTPQKDFADLTGLAQLPTVKLEATAGKDDGNAVSANERRRIRITLKNPASSVAFMVHLHATAGPGGDDLTPIFWDDNYFSLLPGESKQVVAHLPGTIIGSPEAVVELDGFNVAPARLTLVH